MNEMGQEVGQFHSGRCWQSAQLFEQRVTMLIDFFGIYLGLSLEACLKAGISLESFSRRIRSI